VGDPDPEEEPVGTGILEPVRMEMSCLDRPPVHAVLEYDRLFTGLPSEPSSWTRNSRWKKWIGSSEALAESAGAGVSCADVVIRQERAKSRRQKIIVILRMNFSLILALVGR